MALDILSFPAMSAEPVLSIDRSIEIYGRLDRVVVLLDLLGIDLCSNLYGGVDQSG